MTTVQQTPDTSVRAPETVPDPNLRHAFCAYCYSMENPWANPEFMEAVCGSVVHRTEIPFLAPDESPDVMPANSCAECAERWSVDAPCRRCGRPV